MSVNCINCVKKKWTGPDLLCDECRANTHQNRNAPEVSPNRNPRAPLARFLKAAKDADWMQVVGHGGPPCFHLEDDFCFRAERWDGHKTIGGSGPIHEYVSLENLLRACFPAGPLEIGEAGTRAAGMVREEGGQWRYPTDEEKLRIDGPKVKHLARTYPPLFQPNT